MWDNIDHNRHIIGEFLLDGETLPGEVVYNRNNMQHQLEGLSWKKLSWD